MSAEFLDRMEDGKVNAANRRSRGLHTGKAAAGWDFKRREEDLGTWAHAVAVAKCSLSHAIGFAQDDYLRAAFPERYDDPDLI